MVMPGQGRRNQRPRPASLPGFEANERAMREFQRRPNQQSVFDAQNFVNDGLALATAEIPITDQ